MLNIHHLRKDFIRETLTENDLPDNPFKAFEKWLLQAIEAQALEPNAMSLATVGTSGIPSARIVLLKELRDDGFIFFTNYESRKAQQLQQNNACSLNFNWNELERQVRIEGHAHRISPEQSDRYFEVRPEKSKLGAWASPQSQVIPNRDYLDILYTNTQELFKNKTIVRPPNWGGYIVYPHLMEFWQGRSNRLHDRLQYRLCESKWICERLAP